MIPGSGRNLEKEMTTPSNILAWEISWTEEPGMGSQKVGHNLLTKQHKQKMVTMLESFLHKK